MANIIYKPKVKPTTFIIRDKFVYTVWIGRSNEKLVSGLRVVNELFSLESFVVTKKPEYQGTKELAKKITPNISALIVETDNELRESLKVVQEQLDTLLKDPIYELLQFGTSTYQKEIAIDANISWPLVNQFIKTFLLIDIITEKLHKIYQVNAITFSEYKNRQRLYLKPIWKCMTKIDELIRSFHQVRKKINKEQG